MKIPTGGKTPSPTKFTNRLPSFKLLSGFEATARLSSYSKAADELCISQSAVSHQIAQLEQLIGEPLFRRKGRGIELTISGILLYESVVSSLEAIRHGLGCIETYLNPNLVTIVCPAPVVHGWLQYQLEQMRAEIPECSPVISTYEAARFVDELDVDLVITRGSIHQEETIEKIFLQNQIITVGSRDMVRKLVATPKENHAEITSIVFCENDLAVEKTNKFFNEYFAHFNKSVLYDDPRLQLDAIKHGMGIGIVSSILAHEGLENGSLAVVPCYPILAMDSFFITRLACEPRIELIDRVWEFLLTASRKGNLTHFGTPL